MHSWWNACTHSSFRFQQISSPISYSDRQIAQIQGDILESFIDSSLSDHFRIRPCGRWWCCHPQGRYCSWSICTYDAFGENLRILDLLPLAGISSSRTSQIRSILCQLPSIVTSRKIPRATSFVEERAVQGYPKRIKNMKRKGKSHQYNGRISWYFPSQISITLTINDLATSWRRLSLSVSANCPLIYRRPNINAWSKSRLQTKRENRSNPRKNR